VLSRVLIKGEKFGRSAWEDQNEVRRQQLNKIFMQDGEQFKVEIEKENPTEAERPTLKPRENVKIVAIDLQPMSPLQGITCLRADITHPATIPLMLQALDSDYNPDDASQQSSHPVDLVLSDGAPDVTGLHDLDIYVQGQLLAAALNLALCVLRPGGKFVAKIFRGRNVDLLFAQLKLFFESVTVSKPRSSRASSVEAFIVCLNYRPIEGFKPTLSEPLGTGDYLSNVAIQRKLQKPIAAPVVSQNPTTGGWNCTSTPVSRIRQDGVVEVDMETEGQKDPNSWIAPFLACGDLSSLDADASYHLPKDRITLDPVQPPTAPPYKRALEMRKAAGGANGKTKST
jgi:tRNA (cytidine32/guanosine34-2'-O)-methyltransferase